VAWDRENQKKIQAGHFNWEAMPDRIPTTLQVLYAQEDLWVLDALMRIIKKTNAGATGRHNAAARRIQFIRIGKNAERPHGMVRAAGTKGADEDAGGGATGAPAKLHSGEGGQAGYRVGADPAENRYVDMENQPLSAQQLRGTSGPGGAADAHLAVAKRMPVQMKLVIDQRKLNRLLIECGNSPLTVEVQQFRFHSLGETRADGGNPEDRDYPDDRTVEIYGIISIYNEDNVQSLGYAEQDVAGAASDEEKGQQSETPGAAKSVPATGPESGPPDTGAEGPAKES